MRLLERTLRWVSIAPRRVTEDALGGVTEGFSDALRPVRASVIPSTGGLKNHATGLYEAQSICLLIPLDAQIAVGDGICVDSDRPEWRCVEVLRWSAHCAVRATRIAA